jgi:hypothetical protein
MRPRGAQVGLPLSTSPGGTTSRTWRETAHLAAALLPSGSEVVQLSSGGLLVLSRIAPRSFPRRRESRKEARRLDSRLRGNEGSAKDSKAARTPASMVPCDPHGEADRVAGEMKNRGSTQSMEIGAGPCECGPTNTPFAPRSQIASRPLRAGRSPPSIGPTRSSGLPAAGSSPRVKSR